MMSVPVLRSAQVLARHLPRPVAAPLVTVASRGYARFAAQERRVVERNLRRIYGDDLDEATPATQRRDRVFENYGRYWLDSLRLPDMTPEQIDVGFTYEGIAAPDRPASTAGITPVVAHAAPGWVGVVRRLAHQGARAGRSPRSRSGSNRPSCSSGSSTSAAQLGMHIIPLGPSAAAEVARRSWPRAPSSACCATATSAATASWWSSSASGPACPVVRR